MASEVNDLTMNFEQDGLLLVKEPDKVVLSGGAWATVLYRYQQWDRKKEEYGPDRYSIRRYRKINNEYIQQSKFTISSKDQAGKIVEALLNWTRD